jgi:hypothetical protein
MQELLVVFRTDASAEGLATARSRFSVVAHAPPRLAVIAGAVRREDVEALPGVEVVLDATSSVPAGLDEPERLFVEGWLLRSRGGPKPRAGEGRSWDSEGFLPPDDPKDRN